VKIGRALTGQLMEVDFFKAAENSDEKERDGHRGDAYLYSGTLRLIAGDKTTAMDYFLKCMATPGETKFSEYDTASAELKFLQAAK